MKKLLTILVFFSMIGFKTPTVNADDSAKTSKLSSIESDIAILKSNLDTLTKTVDELKGSINNLTPLTKTIEELKGSINNLTPLIKTIERLKCSIGCVSKDCSDIKKDIWNIQMRVLRLLC